MTMKVTMVTISYNQGEYLAECIESVLAQRDDGVDLEYVVVDAESTDDSSEILHRYRGDIDRLLVEPDDGPADGLNKGFFHTTGDILGFLNADDLLERGALATVAYHMERQLGIDVLVGGLRIIHQKPSGRRESFRLPRPFSLGRYLAGAATTLQQSTFFTRRIWQRVDGFNPVNRTCWDAELFLDMALAGARFGRLNNVLGTFRLHENSISGSGRGADAYQLDRDRLYRKVVAAGVSPPHPLLGGMVRLGQRIHPIRRPREVFMLTTR